MIRYGIPKTKLRSDIADLDANWFKEMGALAGLSGQVASEFRLQTVMESDQVDLH